MAISSIFIIDPLYTLPLLIGITAFLIRGPQTSAIMAGLLLSTLYLGWSATAQQIIQERVGPTLAKEGLEEAPRLDAFQYRTVASDRCG